MGIHTEQMLTPYDHAQRAHKLFQEIEQLNSKRELVAHLEGAYGGVQDFREEEASLLHMYGRCVYGGDMVKSLLFFQLSLSVQLVARGIFESSVLPQERECALKEIPDRMKGYYFSKLDAAIEKGSGELLTKLLEGGESEAFLAAKNLRWLGHSLQNIDSYAQSEYADRFEAIYGLARRILERIGKESDLYKDAQWEIAEILYNTGPFVHGLRHKGDIEGAFETLKKVEPYLEAERDSFRTRVKRGQLHNRIGNMMASLVKKEEKRAEKEGRPKDELKMKELLARQYEETSTAEEIANSTEGFPPFLRTMFAHNRALTAMNCNKGGLITLSSEAISGRITRVLSDMENSDDHYYHATYLCSASRFEVQYGTKEKAQEYLQRALNLCITYPASCEDMEKPLAALKNEIAAMQ